jgi:hypothetical protein
MFSFSQYLTEKKDLGGLSTNEAGKLHEVLLGGLVHHYAQEYQKNKSLGHKKAHEAALAAISNPKRVKGSYMYNITHMPQFKDVDNKTAKQLHDEFGSKLSSEKYHDSYLHALHGASHLIDHLHKNGIKDIKGVHFTANKKDINRLPGYENIEDKKNNSDIVVEHGHKGRYFGVSLKSGKESKLNNPGMGPLRKFIDEYHQKITGKKGTFGVDALNAENAAKQAHLGILNKNKSFLNKHFGENGITLPGHIKTNKEGNLELSEDAFRYLEKAEPAKEDKYAHMYSDPKTRKQFQDLYANLRDSRTETAKRATNASMSKHLQNIFAQQKDPSKHEAIREFMKKFYNIGRQEGQMPVVRLNTAKNTAAAVKKGAPERFSTISDAESDFDKGFDSSIGNYKITSNPGTINTTISSPTGHNTSLVVDSSPAGGGSMVNRAGVHVWDKSEHGVEPPSVPASAPVKRSKPVSTRVAPNGYPEHMHQAHKDSTYMGHQDI